MNKKDINKFAQIVVKNVGSFKFFLFIVSWSFIWLGWNLLAPANLRFDPSPAFVLWLFISNVIQICLMPLVLIGQNVQSDSIEKLENKIYLLEKEIKKDLEEIKKSLKEK